MCFTLPEKKNTDNSKQLKDSIRGECDERGNCVAKKIEVQNNMILKSSKLEKRTEYFERIRVRANHKKRDAEGEKSSIRTTGDSAVKNPTDER